RPHQSMDMHLASLVFKIRREVSLNYLSSLRASSRMTVTISNTMTETAASVGLSCRNMSSHICFGNVDFKPPETKIAMVSSSNDVTKANKAAESSPPRN